MWSTHLGTQNPLCECNHEGSCARDLWVSDDCEPACANHLVLATHLKDSTGLWTITGQATRAVVDFKWMPQLKRVEGD